MDTLSCTTQYYYVVGLNCGARTWVGANLDSRTLTHFHDVLRRVQPSYLQLHFVPRRTTSELLAESYRIAHLTHLDVSVEVWLYQHGVEHFLVSEISSTGVIATLTDGMRQDCLAASINSLGPILFLRLHILYCQAPYALQDLFNSVSSKELSQMLTRAIPSLRFLSLCLTRNLPAERGKDQWSCWQITRDARGSSPSRLLSTESGMEMERRVGFMPATHTTL